MRTIITIASFLRSRTRVIALVGAMALVLSACAASTDGDAASTTDERLSVVATTTIWGDVVNEIVGDRADVTVLIPIGVDPHAFEVSARQAAEIQEADLVIANGLGLEPRLTNVLDNAQAEGTRIVHVGEYADPVAFGSADNDVCNPDQTPPNDEDEPAEQNGAGEVRGGADLDNPAACDPHVWLDPARVILAVDEIENALTEIDGATDWSTSANGYRETLADTLSDMSARLNDVPIDMRKLVTNHDSLTYFADRFGFDVVGVIIPGGSTLGDPSSQELTQLVDTIEREGVNAIFSETTESDDLAQALAEETGGSVRVVELFTGSLGGPGSGAETLIDMLNINATLVADALAR